jgi:glycine/D-amino acid oxidase-like deaminating enzyme
MNLVVLGGGIMGLSVAWAALGAGHRVALYEQGPIPNPHGSSADQHRLIRYPYGDDTGYCAMVTQAYEAWEDLWSDLGETLYVGTGTLMLSAGPDDWAERSRAVLDRRRIPYRTIAGAELASEFSFLAPDQVQTAYHHLPTLAGHPDEDRNAGEEEARAVFELARVRLVDFADYRLLRARTCFYSITEGERFIAERLDNAWVLGGFSGHGFKFAPLIGRTVIDAVAGALTPAEVAAWAAGRSA